MSDKPMVLTKENVLATKEGRKKMTRRIINPQPKYVEHEDIGSHREYKHYQVDTPQDLIGLTFFQVGDRAYVKEGYQITGFHVCQKPYRTVSGIYLADKKPFSKILTEQEHKKWLARDFPLRKTPGRFMYKSLARIFLPIVEVKVERLQDITPADCEAEGITLVGDELVFNNQKQKHSLLRTKFFRLWDSIHGDGATERNDWVLVYRWDEIIIKGE